MKIDQFYLCNQNSSNYVVLNKPGESIDDLIIFLHGFTSKLIEKNFLFRHIARQVSRRLGFATLMFDLSAHGDSSGHFEESTLQGWLQEVNHIFEFAKSLEAKRIHLIGTGFGNFLGCLLCNLQKQEVFSFTLLSPSDSYVFPFKGSDFHLYQFDLELNASLRINTDIFWGHELVFENQILHDWLLRMGALDFDNICERINSHFFSELNNCVFLNELDKICNLQHVITGKNTTWMDLSNNNNSKRSYSIIKDAANDLHNKPEWQNETIEQIIQYYSKIVV